jgi:phospholipid/cholesterol/gamma-HCH transport system substrate-binding protein
MKIKNIQGAIAKNMTRVIVGVVVLAIAVGVGVYFFARGPAPKKVTAQFSSGVGVFPHTPVDILGVHVGEVTKVTPKGDHVDVEMEYDAKYDVPADAVAVTVANSLVSNRYIQLAPAYKGTGATMKSGTLIPLARTASPAELDDIYGALNKLSVALGPQGANKDGALNALVKVAAANLDGNGAALGQSLSDLSKAVQTLANGRDDLFGTVKNLNAFTKALSDSDAQVRHFEEQLAVVSQELAAERTTLGTALKQLGGALNKVATFVKDNSAKVHTDVVALRRLTEILLKQKASLNETLAVAPVALANIVHAYQEDVGALGTRSNLASLVDPGQICQLLDLGGLLDAAPAVAPIGGVIKPVTDLLGPLTDEIVKTCNQVIKNVPSASRLQLPAGLTPDTLNNLLDQLLTGLPAGGGLIGGN